MHTVSDLYAVAQLVRQHHQGAVETLDEVGGLQGGAVHLGVGPDGGDEGGDAPGRLLDLAQQCRVGEGGAHPLHRGAEGGTGKAPGDLLAPLDIRPGGRQRRRDLPVPVHLVVHQPLGELVLAVGQGDGRGRRLVTAVADAQPEVVEDGELLRGDAGRGEVGQRDEQGGGGALEGVRRARRRRRRVVELVRETGGEGAEGDEGFALASGRLDPADGVDESVDEVQPEREPLLGQPAQLRGLHAQHPSGGLGTAGGEVDAELVPSCEPAGPLPRARHVAEHRLLGAHLPDERDAPLEQDPPVVRRPLLLEEHISALHHLLRGSRQQLLQLGVVEAVEEGQGPQLADVHQTLAR